MESQTTGINYIVPENRENVTVCVNKDKVVESDFTVIFTAHELSPAEARGE